MVILNQEILTCDPLKYKMEKSVLIVSIYMGKSIRMKRVKIVDRRNEKNSDWDLDLTYF